MNHLFALDIGTRTVVGLILQKEDDVYRVIDMVSREHKERSMVDGQIHNIIAVSDVIQEVKNELEAKHGTLNEVCVAAAGRALKTMNSSVTVNISEQPLMTSDDIFHLELAAVQQAQYQLAEQEEEASSTQYYCVGYSVLHYHLDEQEIGSLIDQQGEQAQVDIIATFLPKVVVESLLSALQRAGLEMQALTLEPIAAIQVLIPQSMRKLNVALVDIGAGTSDIAITKDGTVIAYGMVPKAGDEITEALSQQYLLDFHQAEEAKRQLVEENKMEIEDILGFTSEVPIEDATKEIYYAIDQLADSICNQVIELNKQSPQAVMLVGGGSLTPNLTQYIAEKLQLPKNRVAVRGIEAIKDLKGQEQLPSSPEYVTPIGIAIASQQSPVHYISVTVNERMVRLFDIKQLTIGDCLLAAGIELKKLYGKPGMGIVVTFNGKSITLPGTYGTAPTIKINGKSASIQDSISHSDEIEVIRGEDGETPKVTVQDLTGPLEDLTIQLNNEKIKMPQEVKLNGREANFDDLLQDGDEIYWQPKTTVQDVLLKHVDSSIHEKVHPFKIKVNGKGHLIKDQMLTLNHNAKPAQLDTTIKDFDQINYEVTDHIIVSDLLELLEVNLQDSITVIYDGQPVNLSYQLSTITRQDQPLSIDSLIYPNDQIEVKEQHEQQFIFQDLFRFIDIDMNETKGKHFKLYRNGEEVGFTEPIFDGDQLNIKWVEMTQSHS
ncbi:cell division protein FtsA [Alkalibacillus haloalkaliphilus]|uniref:cell division protein FtsA n=1 Tax=Alkalibacillus haloalkaliphilus TaxID=94136 RepID=UPI0029354B1D|nr:cell division protein FtsA [Alkalibacillus haloalkaliphilus]MDV2581248.1 cell division protein FtsA [Alkalibacillus haloalkaliphilus]